MAATPAWPSGQAGFQMLPYNTDVSAQSTTFVVTLLLPGGEQTIEVGSDEHIWDAALAAYDISDLTHIREVSRVTFDDKQKPHWIAADADGRRIVLNSGEYGDHRLFILNFDPQTGALTLDGLFRDAGSERSGVSMDGKSWPHGFHGDAYPHGTVFSRPTAAVKSASTRD